MVLSLGGEGIGLSLGFLNRFVKDINDVTMVVLTGHNNALLSQIKARDFGEKIHAFGYQDFVGEYIATADVLAGKCGTNYAMLAAKSRRPLIIMRAGAPNEFANMRVLIKGGYAWYCPTPLEFVSAISELAHDPEKYAAALDRLDHVGAGNGAETMAESIIERLETGSAANRQARA